MNSPTGIGAFSIGSRIAKPLRGGGEVAAVNPTVASLQNPTENKRNSWFFSQRS